METIDACEKYLGNLGVSLWGDWEIQNTERRHLAARWLAKQIDAVNAVRQEHDFPSQDGKVQRPFSLHHPPAYQHLGPLIAKADPPKFPTIFDPFRVDL